MVLDLLRRVFGFHGEVKVHYVDKYGDEIVKEEIPRCIICGKRLGGISLYRCYYCDNVFCEDHRLPEKHDCAHVMSASAELRAGCAPASYTKYKK